jgi:hypothetical protein
MRGDLVLRGAFLGFVLVRTAMGGPMRRTSPHCRLAGGLARRVGESSLSALNTAGKPAG